MAKMSRYSSLILVLLCIYNICLSEASKGGFSVEMIHRDSPRSPFYRSTETQYERVMNAVRRSIDRANYFNQSLVSPDTAEATITSDHGEYLMTYSVGTPPFQHYAVVDTGSSILWMQCQPCTNCYKQTTPIFDPSKSTTYRTLPCSSTTCKSVRTTSCSSGDAQTCEYKIRYGDNSYSQGDLSVDTLTLESTQGSSVQFPNTVIGCGHDNIGNFHPEDSGIVGLGGGPVSLISQLSSSIDGKFSYCLPPMFADTTYTSKLNFGDAAVVSGSGTVSTPITSSGSRTFYYLTLESLTVEGIVLEFEGSSTMTSTDSGGKGNIIIDSGTTLTLLPPEIYSKLESTVANQIKLQQVISPTKLLTLCYHASPGELHAPRIMARFTGATVTLNDINTFVQVAPQVACFAFRSDERFTIFGNLAQQNFLIGYDLRNNMLSFKPMDCTKA